MKKIVLVLTILFTMLGLANAQSVAGDYTGKITYADMNGRDVTHRFEQTLTFSVIDKGNNEYALRAYLDFYGGPAHHEIDFSDERVTFKLDGNGNIQDASGKGHITVTVLIVKFKNKDFTVQPMTGSIVNGELKLHMVCNVIGEDYTAVFDFKGHK